MTVDHPLPGWYPDPDGKPMQRWWDGEAWADRYAPNAPGPVARRARLQDRVPGWAIAILIGVIVIGIAVAVRSTTAQNNNDNCAHERALAAVQQKPIPNC